ncbi:MAG TPA: hypothetical protein PKV73_18435 [Agriterribacter sp.]|nr:hypothetical protein [Agriterribacter sp.]
MKLKSLLTTAILTMVTLVMYIPTVMAQLPDDPGVDPDDIPLDGGLSMLIAAGVAYGAKKAYDKRKKEPKAPVNSKEVE